MDVCFVFGSNLAGRHGKGAALHAKRFYQAQQGCGAGPTGRAYAIPTKDKDLRPLGLDVIAGHIDDFFEYAYTQPDVLFMFTPVGCGLAGNNPVDMATLILENKRGVPANVLFTRHWLEHLTDPAMWLRNR